LDFGRSRKTFFGHSRTQIPQPVHFSSSITGKEFSPILIAEKGQTLTQ
jgi:hypothetical protein